MTEWSSHAVICIFDSISSTHCHSELKISRLQPSKHIRRVIQALHLLQKSFVRSPVAAEDVLVLTRIIHVNERIPTTKALRKLFSSRYEAMRAVVYPSIISSRGPREVNVYDYK